jgi:hypothetical protein
LDNASETKEPPARNIQQGLIPAANGQSRVAARGGLLQRYGDQATRLHQAAQRQATYRNRRGKCIRNTSDHIEIGRETPENGEGMSRIRANRKATTLIRKLKRASRSRYQPSHNGRNAAVEGRR